MCRYTCQPTPPTQHKLLVSASKDRSIRVWRIDAAAKHGDALLCLPTAHRDVVRAVAIVDGQLYSTGRDKTLRLWEQEEDGDGDVGDADGRSVAPGGSFKCARSLAAHTEEVLTLTARADGGWPRHAPLQLGGQSGLLFSASRGGEVRIWDRESLVCLDAWVVHSSAVHALLVRDDCLISASGDGSIKVARAAPARGRAELPPQTA